MQLRCYKELLFCRELRELRMSLSTGLRVLVFVLLSRGSLGTISLRPSNAVAELNGQAVFYSEATVFRGSWYFSKTGILSDEIAIVIPPCAVNTGNGAHYGTNTTGGTNACNLIVANITMAQAGVYRYAEMDSVSALLIVTDTLSNATYNTTAGVVVEKDNVIIECVLNYNGTMSPAPTLRPYFNWTDFNGQNVSSSYNSTTDDTAVSQLKVTAGRQNITSYTCHVYFQLMPPTNTGYASNIPTVSNSATSPNITVSYCPGNISTTTTVSTADNCVYKQENLTCTADANPKAQYEWLDLKNNSKTSGPVKSIEYGGKYQCIASNTIRSQPCSITATVTQYDCYPVDEKNMTIGGHGCTNGSCYCTGSQPLELTCNASSLPAPTYQWHWNDALQMDYFGNQTIRLIYDGTYSCTANSSFGTTFSMATVSSKVYNCTVPPSTTTPSVSEPTATIATAAVPPSTTQSIVSESTATVSTTGSATACTSGDNCPVAVAAAIAVGVILFISLALNIMQLVIMVKNMRTKNEPYKRTGTMMPPETLDLSNEPPAPATYEELTRSNEIHLQPTYDKLTPKPPAPATYQELTHPDEIHLQPPTYEKLTSKPPSYVDDLS